MEDGNEDNWCSYTTISLVPSFNSITFGDTFVGIDYAGIIYSSSDFGNTWNSNINFTDSGFGIAYANGIYVGVGANRDSNCILTANATNMLTYTLEPVTIQPQIYVLPAPTIDWVNTNYDIYGNLIISWFPVPNATSYKIFIRSIYKTNINKYNVKATVTLNTSLNANFFDADSGPIYDVSYFITSNDVMNYRNYYVFAYRNGVRSSFPPTQIFASNSILQLWPVKQYEYHGGSNKYNFTSVTARNLNTNQSIIMSSNDFFFNNTYANTASVVIGTNTPISNK